MNTGRQGRQFSLIDPLSEPAIDRKALNEENFRRVIAIERKRTERSKAPFVLMLIEIANQSAEKAALALESVMSVLLATSRDTDLVGWYKSNTTIGALFTGLACRRQELDSDDDSKPGHQYIARRADFRAI